LIDKLGKAEARALAQQLAVEIELRAVIDKHGSRAFAESKRSFTDGSASKE
jgi:hypothetical protein